MVAAPQSGTFTLIGLRSRRTYTVDVYLSDVANALARFDSGLGAGSASDTFWMTPEPMYLVDFTINTGMTDTTKVSLIVNSAPTGVIFRFAERLNTLATRAPVSIPIPGGVKLGLIQLA